MSETGEIASVVKESVRTRTSWWREDEKGGYDFDYPIWRENLLALPKGKGLLLETIAPALQDASVLEVITRASMSEAGLSGDFDDLTDQTQTIVLGSKIGIILEHGKKTLIASLVSAPIAERQAKIGGLEGASKIVRNVATARGANPEEFNLTLEDRVRFVVQGRMGHGTITESVTGVLKDGLRVDTKRNTSPIPAASEAAENLRQFGMYDPLTYNNRENSAVVVYGEGVRMDDSSAMSIRNYETALERGEIRVSGDGQFVFTAEPELILCRTVKGKEEIMRSLPSGLKDKWKERILTFEELAGENPARLA